MEPIIYESKRIITLKNGTQKEYINRKKYIPKREKGYTRADIVKELQSIEDRELLKEIKQFIVNSKQQYGERKQQLDNTGI